MRTHCLGIEYYVSMKKLTIIIIFVLAASMLKAAEPVKSVEAQQLMQLLESINGEKTLSGTMGA